MNPPCLSLSWSTESFTNPLLWPHCIIKCLSDAYFRILIGVVGHPVTFCPLFYETMNLDVFYSAHIQDCFSHAAMNAGIFGCRIGPPVTFIFNLFYAKELQEHSPWISYIILLLNDIRLKQKNAVF